MAALYRAAETGAAILRAAVADGQLPGAAFGVAHADRGAVLTQTFGTADLSTGRAVSPDTPFCLASTTKPISTTVLAAMIEGGVIGLDHPITAHVPEFLPGLWAARPPTVREVATHTAGLGVHHRFFYEDERPPIPVVDAVRTLARPAFPIGVQWRYSNLGYGALQLAMERAGGATMADLVQQHVFGPLGMTSSSWGGLHGPAGAAVRYLTPTEPYVGYVTDHPPASEAWCSISDLLAFGLAHARSSLLSPAGHTTLAEPHAPRQPDGAAYALGWVTREYSGVRLLVHGGRMGGVGAHLAVVPSLGLVVAALANIETDRLSEAVAAVLSATVPEYAPSPPAPAWTSGATHPSLAARWEGIAQFGDDALPMTIDALGERVSVQIAGMTTELVMPHLQRDAVRGHANLSVPHPLAPTASICHLDALPMITIDGTPTAMSEQDRPDVIVGALSSAQYPGPARLRQGDTVSAAVYLERAR